VDDCPCAEVVVARSRFEGAEAGICLDPPAHGIDVDRRPAKCHDRVPGELGRHRQGKLAEVFDPRWASTG
jgi:hypothetical protein